MALHNEIQVGRYNRFVQKLLGIKGGPPVPTVSSDFIFEHDVFGGVELHYLQGWDRFNVVAQPTGLAGNSTAVQIRNPTTSNVMMVLERAYYVPTGAAPDGGRFFVVRSATTDQATVINAASLDKRSTRQSSMTISHNNGSALAGIGGTASVYVHNFAVAVNSSVDFLRLGEEIPICPGDAVFIEDDVVASQIFVAFVWRERFLEESERT